jgi:hypothetical protein
MLSKSKIMPMAAVALLAVAGGVYALGSNEPNVQPSSSAQRDKVADSTKPNAADNAPDVAGQTGEKDAGATATVQAPSVMPPAQSAPIKLTKQQLTPPAPKTEDEKLQKAAEQEYNRF